MSIPPLHAQVVLDDCKLAFARLGAAKDEIDRRLMWVLCCALLKAVSHVLHEVDANSGDEHLKVVINNWWAETYTNKPKYPMLWSFINTERANILKRYQFNVQFALEEFDLVTEDGDCLVDELGNTIGGMSDFLQEPNSVFDNKTPMTKLTEAITWWEDEFIILGREYNLRVASTLSKP